MTAETTIADYFPQQVKKENLTPGYYMYYATEKELTQGFGVNEIIQVANVNHYFIIGDERAMDLQALDGDFFSLACIDEQISSTPAGQIGIYKEIRAALDGA